VYSGGRLFVSREAEEVTDVGELDEESRSLPLFSEDANRFGTTAHCKRSGDELECADVGNAGGSETRSYGGRNDWSTA
jgi:hypothetical protein